MEPKVVTRFAPSPTGLFHAGSYRTAVFSYLFARKHGGDFILRIEDTDRNRSKKEYEDNILKSLEWMGLGYSAFFRQSDNVVRHQELLQKLIETGHVYVSKETPTEEGQRTEVLRFRNPNEVVTFTDAIRGPISTDTTDLGDFIIGRSITEPLHHFSLVVDDADEGVTHVIRGEDHISNTPRQILIQRALGFPQPVYAHLPLVLGPDRSKLSKRRGAKALTHYRDEGFIPEAIVNYIALLGWHPTDDRELFSLEELAQAFDITRIQKGGAIFDETKMRWFNREHLKRLAPHEYEQRLETFLRAQSGEAPTFLHRAAPLLQDRTDTFADAAALIQQGEFDFLDGADADKELFVRGAKVPEEEVATHLAKAGELLAEVSESEWTAEKIKEAVFPYANEAGRSAVLWPLRIALSGREKSPDPFTIAALIGKEATLSRIEKARQKFYNQ